MLNEEFNNESKFEESKALQARILDYQLSPEDINKWSGEDVFMTLWFNALSTLIPHSERMVCEVLRRAKSKVEDIDLLNEIDGFIRQEAQHTLSHLQYNQIFSQKGYDLEKMSLKFFRSQSHFKSIPRALAVASATEHMLACVGDIVFQHDLLKHAEINFRSLWEIHLMEEIEHRHVTFNTHQHLKCTFKNRLQGMMIASSIFPILLFKRHMMQIIKEGYFWNVKMWSVGLWRAWVYPGYFRKIFCKMLNFSKHKFNPNGNGKHALIHKLDAIYSEKILKRR